MRNRKSAFTLIEVLIFVSIFTTLFVSIASSTTQFLRNSKTSETKILATRYTEELIEWLKGEKEEDWATFVNIRSSLTGVTWCFNQGTSWVTSESCTDYSLVNTFKREAKLTTFDDTKTQVNVEVKVVWEEAGKQREVKVNTVFTIPEDTALAIFIGDTPTPIPTSSPATPTPGGPTLTPTPGPGAISILHCNDAASGGGGYAGPCWDPAYLANGNPNPWQESIVKAIAQGESQPQLISLANQRSGSTRQLAFYRDNKINLLTCSSSCFNGPANWTETTLKTFPAGDPAPTSMSSEYNQIAYYQNGALKVVYCCSGGAWAEKTAKTFTTAPEYIQISPDYVNNINQLAYLHEGSVKLLSCPAFQSGTDPCPDNIWTEKIITTASSEPGQEAFSGARHLHLTHTRRNVFDPNPPEYANVPTLFYLAYNPVGGPDYAHQRVLQCHSPSCDDFFYEVPDPWAFDSISFLTGVTGIAEGSPRFASLIYSGPSEYLDYITYLDCYGTSVEFYCPSINPGVLTYRVKTFSASQGPQRVSSAIGPDHQIAYFSQEGVAGASTREPIPEGSESLLDRFIKLIKSILVL